MTTLDSLKPICAGLDSRTNERGNEVHSGHTCDHYDGDDSRYRFDTGLCRGWKQYDTDQDAWYFGVWVHLGKRETLTYAEGDVILVVCPDDTHLAAELAHMGEFYGAPPPAFRCIDVETGAVTHIYDERPVVA